MDPQHDSHDRQSQSENFKDRSALKHPSVKVRKAIKGVRKNSTLSSDHLMSEKSDNSSSIKRKSEIDILSNQQKIVKTNDRESSISRVSQFQETLKKPIGGTNFFENFTSFYEMAAYVTEDRIKFRYIKELFNIDLDTFPNDEEIMQIQQTISSSAQAHIPKLKKNWNDDEKKVLIWIIGKISAMKAVDLKNISDQDWDTVATLMNRRDRFQCKQKWLQMLKIPLQQAPWTVEEDDFLRNEIIANRKFQEEKKGNKWSQIARQLNKATNSNIHRNGKQCRERWNNFLNPCLNRKPWCDVEDLDLLKSVLQNGKKWALISKSLEVQRSENAVKNRFNCLVKKEKNFLQKQDISVERPSNDDYSPEFSQVDELSDDNIKSIQSLISKLEWRITQQEQMAEVKKEVEVDFKLEVKKEEPKPQPRQKYRGSLDFQEDQKKQIQTLTEAMEHIEIENKVPPDVQPPLGSFTFQADRMENMNAEDLLMAQSCLVNLKKGTIFFLSSEQIIEFINCQRQQIALLNEQMIPEADFLNYSQRSQNLFNRTLQTIEEQVQSSAASLPSMGNYFNLRSPSIVIESEKRFGNPLEVLTRTALGNHLNTSNAIGTSNGISTSNGIELSYHHPFPNYGMFANYQQNPSMPMHLLQSLNNITSLPSRTRTDPMIAQQVLNAYQRPVNSAPTTNNVVDYHKRPSFRIQSLANYPEQ